MTTITYPDITHKKPVPEKFNPNSYRILSEDIPEHQSIPFWYGHARPQPLYTEPAPNDLPLQVSEARNNPHAARKVNMVYTNAATFNAPFGIVKTDNVKHEEKHWWDWSQPTGEPYGPGAKSHDEWTKVRESSYRNAFGFAGEGGPYAKKNTRYSANPEHIRTVGVVPITDFKPENLGPINQKLVEKVSFEQHYDSRKTINYPLRGKRHGAFVIEEQRPTYERPKQSASATSTKFERTASMWDLLHPSENFRGQIPSNPYKYRRQLPEAQRESDYGQVWQTAPFANDFQVGRRFQQPQMINEVDFE